LHEIGEDPNQFNAAKPDELVCQIGDASILPIINLGTVLAPLSADVLLGDFMTPEGKPEDFKIHISKQGALPAEFVIDSVNGKAVEAMPLIVMESRTADGNVDLIATIKIKALAKHFQNGINRFEVAFTENGERTAVEAILNVQI
jgi:hypothetical protein